MSQRVAKWWRRREFLSALCSGSIAVPWVLASSRGATAAGKSALRAGGASVDITPPLGIEMAGFHRPAGKERRIEAIRQRGAARAIVLECGGDRAAIVSVDLCAVSSEVARRVQSRVAARVGIPATAVRLCATHTHSMPTLRYFRQWGAVSEPYMAEVESKVVEAVGRAAEDLAPASLRLGKARARGANHNRTTKSYKTDEQFTATSTDEERWLDTTLHALLFERTGGKENLLWYHFSAHPVCYADEQAGPDWPGTVARLVRENFHLEASFLQGHIGDVNPGDGSPWRGDIEETTGAVYRALSAAIDQAQPLSTKRLQTVTRCCKLPLDLALFRQWLEAYRRDPSKCSSGPWVDAGFAKDWFEANANRKVEEDHLEIPLSAIRLGDVALLFHPAELYSYYGLAIRRDSPFPNTLVVGYTDDLIGYLPDPKAYQAGEYSAITVPRIIDLPPFRPDAARTLTTAAVELLRGLAT